MAKKKKARKKAAKPTTDAAPSVSFGLPSRDELATLPLRAIIAYAVRSARRVQPVCIEMGGEAIRAVDAVLDLASRFANGEQIESYEVGAVSIIPYPGIGMDYAYNTAVCIASAVTSAVNLNANDAVNAAADCADSAKEAARAASVGYGYYGTSNSR